MSESIYSTKDRIEELLDHAGGDMHGAASDALSDAAAAIRARKP